MAKEYKVGEKYYLPVTVKSICPGYNYPIELGFIDSNLCDTDDTTSIADEPDVLLTADEIATVINTERDDALAELKSRNAELEALLKEVMATRDEAIKQNNELIAENKKLKADCNDWKDTADDRIVDVQNLTAERDNLKADLTTQKEVNEELKAWYEEANKTATEAAEANDELKTKIAELRDEVATLKAERCSLNGQVGKNLAEIQALSSDVHFFKEACKKQKAECDELKGRYDELDSVNHEQAEKIRDLDKTVAKLKDENTNLSFLLEDQPEKEVTKPLHVVLNDGTEIEFRRYTAYDYRTDIKMFVVKDGEKYIAGFLRGDKPMNLAYWWTE